MISNVIIHFLNIESSKKSADILKKIHIPFEPMVNCWTLWYCFSGEAWFLLGNFGVSIITFIKYWISSVVIFSQTPTGHFNIQAGELILWIYLTVLNLDTVKFCGHFKGINQAKIAIFTQIFMILPILWIQIKKK